MKQEIGISLNNNKIFYEVWYKQIHEVQTKNEGVQASIGHVFID